MSSARGEIAQVLNVAMQNQYATTVKANLQKLVLLQQTWKLILKRQLAI